MPSRKVTKRNPRTIADSKRPRKLVKDLGAPHASKVKGGRKIIPCV